MNPNRLTKAFNRIADAFASSRQRVENEYLSNSVSIYDLERRMKEIERGKFRGF